MRRRTAIAGGVAGLVATAALVTPAVAAGGTDAVQQMWRHARAGQTQTGDVTPPCLDDDEGGDVGRGHMMGAAGGMMGGLGAGMMGGLGTGERGTLTGAQQSRLAGMAEEEKLAHDLYTAFAAKYPADSTFSHVAAAEAAHLTALRTLLDRYDVADPTAGKAAGHFAAADVQRRYDQLLARGRTSLAAAYAVGVQVEKADVADLDDAANGLTAPDVTRVYLHLEMASQHHLAVFQR
ncbi:MAG TPA: DUF2202 domain-containing protein [Candidatus Eisenbacteria bacterium]|nr:DUF2202 domain-containing protein [Candidatus Eisenbacteria bacterium]